MILFFVDINFFSYVTTPQNKLHARNSGINLPLVNTQDYSPKFYNNFVQVNEGLKH